MGQNILYDVDKNVKCSEVKDSCISTYVIDNNNLVKDEYVNVIPDINSLVNRNDENNFDNLSTIEDYEDNYNSLVKYWNVENKFMHFKFTNNRFPYLVSNTCYWTNTKYDDTHTFAFDKIDAYTSKLYNRANDVVDEKCKVVPVIKIKK